MLDLSRSRISIDKEIKVTSGYTINAEGLCLVSALEDGIETVKPSEGVNTEKFIGFSYGEKFSPSTISIVVESIIPSATSYTVNLPRTNIVPDNISVYDVTTSTVLSEDTTVSDGKFTCDDLTGLLTFNSTQKGHEIKVTFRYYPTIIELQNDTDQIYYKPYGSEFLNQIGVIMGYEVFTDQFDASVDWSSATSVKTSADGILTDQTGTGAVINCTIINAPNVDNSFLGIRFSL